MRAGAESGELNRRDMRRRHPGTECGINAGIERKVLVGRNEPGVQNIHRQLHEILGQK